LAAAGAMPHAIDIVDASGTDFDGHYVPAGNGPGNHAVFFVAGTTFSLTVAPGAASGSSRAALNGLQIVHGDRIFGDGFGDASLR
ncbi:MAG: hypothetical protein ACTHK2_15055, partial [Dokdonella sp.]|uniref:hypothetical protein n=1 Tax=Dokdonella sp. TaxID=2291710 RepID=UPI003F80FF96